MAEPTVMLFGLWAQTGLKNHKLDGVQSPTWEGAILGERGAHFKISMDFLPWAVQKRLNQSICHLGCRLGVGRRQHKFSRVHQVAQCAVMEGHIGATWRIRLNHPSAAAMQPYVKLLWPLVILVDTLPSVFWLLVGWQVVVVDTYFIMVDDTLVSNCNVFCFSVILYTLFFIWSWHVIKIVIYVRCVVLCWRWHCAVCRYWVFSPSPVMRWRRRPAVVIVELSTPSRWTFCWPCRRQTPSISAAMRWSVASSRCRPW